RVPRGSDSLSVDCNYRMTVYCAAFLQSVQLGRRFYLLPMIMVMRLTVSSEISSSGKFGKVLLSKGRHCLQNSAISVQEDILPSIAARRMTQKTISSG
ncbi:MAG: hypothetical protein V8Q84_09670, partial [Bilophila sp.]